MCDYFSCLLMKSGKVIWDPRTSSHEALISMHGIADNKSGAERRFLRVEITPRVLVSAVTRNRLDWILHMDEVDSDNTPKWLADHREKFIENCWKAWEKSIVMCLAVGEESKDARNGVEMHAYGNSTVVMYDCARAELHGNSNGRAHNASIVIARDNSSLLLYGNTTGFIFDNASAECFDSTFLTKNGHGKVVLHESAICRNNGADMTIQPSKLEVNGEAVYIGKFNRIVLSDGNMASIGNMEAKVVTVKDFINENRKHCGMEELP